MTNPSINCRSSEELREIYKKLCWQYHPDKGGTVQQFQDLSNQYQEAIKAPTIYIPLLPNIYVVGRKYKYKFRQELVYIDRDCVYYNFIMTVGGYLSVDENNTHLILENQ